MSIRCGARTRSGSPCRRWPALGRARCKLHGGATPRGLASPHYRHGEYSRYALPAALVDAYVRSIEHPNLLSLREGVALTDALVSEALERMEANGVVDWRAASTALAAHDRAALAGDTDGQLQAFARLRHAVEQGVGHAGLVRELLSVLEQGRKLRATEVDRLKTASEVMHVDEMRAMLDFVSTLLREILTREQLVRFADLLNRRLALRGRGALEV